MTTQTAAAIFFKGLTADYLVNRLGRDLSGQTIHFTERREVGSLAIPMLKRASATVIGTVGTAVKVAAAVAAGCDHVVVLSKDTQDNIERIQGWTSGKGVTVVYDSTAGPVRPVTPVTGTIWPVRELWFGLG